MKLLVLLFALCALVLTLVAVLAHQPWWFVAGNGFVAALLVFTGARLS